MARLPVFETLDAKRLQFEWTEHWVIDDKSKFDEWYNRFNSEYKEGARVNFIYRGMKEAKHKLFTAAQRQWIANDMQEWYHRGYLDYIKDLIEAAKSKPLLKKVFDLYEYTEVERDIPILSILQHYGAPTPLMDWTYNINIALFFATESIISGNGNGDIDSYFSIYFVNKEIYKDRFKHLTRLQNKKYPSIDGIIEAVASNELGKSAYYISDFEVYNSSKDRKLKVNTSKPLTTIFNQNIIAQEGLFVLNPHPNNPLEEILEHRTDNKYTDFWNRPFTCFNIKKDLADYIRRRIKNKNDRSGNSMDIDKSFIYPQLSTVVPTIHEGLLNDNINY